MLTWKIVEVAKASVLYIYIDNNKYRSSFIFFNHVIQDYHLFLGVGEEIMEQRLKKKMQELKQIL